MIKCVLLLLVLCALEPSAVSVRQVINIEDKEFWYEEGAARLKQMLEKKRNTNEARNIIIFVGDGMGIPTITSSRIFRHQQDGFSGEEGFLTYDQFPDVGLIKTYNVDRQVPDSAGTATAIFTGVKTNYETIGVDATTTAFNCDATLLETASVSSFIAWAQEEGKDTGIVTTTRITHATPASTYAHITHRDWECDSEIPVECRDNVKDIARQLVEEEPGNKLKVIFGGGLHQLGVENNPEADSSCVRADGRNLAETWLQDKETLGVNAKFVRTTGELMDLKPGDDEYALGLFGLGHVAYDAERDRDPVTGAPSLVNMTVKAIEMLQQGKNGFVLMVEGGRIDHAHHDNYARLALMEAVQLDAAVAAALELTSRDDTLIIVTADHSHAMTMNGYPKRGNDILDYSKHIDAAAANPRIYVYREGKVNHGSTFVMTVHKHSTTDVDNACFCTDFAHDGEDGLPIYETLTYANGPGFNYHRKAGDIAAGEYMWVDLTQDQTRDEYRYQHFAPIFEPWETHGGEDVAVYAIGPFSHLFNGVHEQSYIAHAMSCAGRFGPDAKTCSAAHSLTPGSFGAILLAVLLAIQNLF